LAGSRQPPQRDDAACELLARVYGWFAEGVDSLDLKEVKTFLEEQN
jgi:hypothetical protein